MNNQDDLQVITKSMNLVEHTFILTSNINRYPKKYRYSLVPKIQELSMGIYEKLMEANRTRVDEEKVVRSELQTKAILSCDKLLFFIDLSNRLNLLSYKSMEYWSKMVTDIKYMTIAWRKKTK